MTRLKPFLFIIGLVAGINLSFFGSAALAQGGSLILPDQPGDPIELKHSGEGDPASLLQVFVGGEESCCANRSPLAGRYVVDGDTVVFDPAFDLVARQIYTVLTRNAGVESARQFTLEPQGAETSPEVIAIYPSGPEIPENTLRFYIQFSTPMQPHLSTEFISLLDANGVPDTAAFMTFGQELWSEDRRRLTLLMDPGRIKRGVATNLELGSALLQGQRYSVAVAEGWPAANGGQDALGFVQHFQIVAPLRDLPDTDLWQISQPRVQTLDPLIIAFDRPFDHQLAQGSIRVIDGDGRVIIGTIGLDDHERAWRFTPDSPWPAAVLQIVVDARMEDVAGNNFRDLLDHAVETDVRAIDQIVLPLILTP